ncbi:DUF5134 domain-containing protein [Streptomyces sp. NPDC058045]|uniref:DUF5134 domain-containing protein n=1 Tax=Streptomyces sp. NPDC058045 TaxID=3346311 RepID=UPI0036E03BEA
MRVPGAAAWLLVALCAASGAYCLLRMRSGVAAQRRSAGGEALMGFGMAAMALPAAVLAPPVWAWPAAAVVFGAVTLRAAWSARHDRHHLHHAVGSAAMVYMALAMTGPGGHGAPGTPMPGMAHTGSGPPVLTGLLLLYFAAHALWSGARLVPLTAPAGAPAPTAWTDRPELAHACRLSMSIAMLAMLLTL